jgi:hypothetical protein
MNRLISFVGVLLFSVLGTTIAGYWNARGVVPVGDARIPAWMVGSLLVSLVSVLSVVFGGKVPWTSIAGSLLAKAKDSRAVQNQPVQVTRESVGAIPVQVEYLLGCVHHLRIALQSDEDGQEYLDQIQIKIGRVSAQIGSTVKKKVGGE